MELKKSEKLRNCVLWERTDCVIDEDEDVLFKFYYSTWGNILGNENGKNKYGNSSYIFYIINRNGNLKVKYVDLKCVDKKAFHIGRKLITNLSIEQEFKLGYSSKEYKDYIKKEKMIEVDLNFDFYGEIKKLGSIDYNELEYFINEDSYETIDYYDFVNKKYFYCDDYCLEKYKLCIELVEKIILNCNILNFTKLKFKYFVEDEREGILEKLFEKVFSNFGKIR